MNQSPHRIGTHIRHVGRLVQIVNISARYGFLSTIKTLGILNWLTPAQMREASEIAKIAGVEGAETADDSEKLNPLHLRLALEELGPTFIKFGQLLASRHDLIPENYVDELAKLQNEVSPIPFEEVERILRSELTAEKFALIDSIDPKALAAGSIGQVHVATLKTTGAKVVFKVQRPAIQEKIKTDLALMETLAGLLERYFPLFASLRIKRSVQDFAFMLQGELDFIKEAANTSRMQQNFSNNSMISLPSVYWDFTTPKVLCLEYIEAKCLNDIAPKSLSSELRSKTVKLGIESFLQMVFQDGLLHGDLHGGNILMQDNGRIFLLDLGLVVALTRTNRENLAGLLVSLSEENIEQVIRYFIEIADPDPHFDANSFEEAIQQEIGPYLGLTSKNINFSQLLWKLAGIAARHHAAMPRQMIVFVKTLASFEGIGSKFDPDFDILSTCREFSKKLMQDLYSADSIKKQSLLLSRDLAQMARKTPRQLSDVLRMVQHGHLQLRIKHADTQLLINTLNSIGSRLAISIILAATLIGSSIMVLSGVGERLYGVPLAGLVGFGVSFMLSLYVIFSIWKN